jgi:hypothetical protein
MLNLYKTCILAIAFITPCFLLSAEGQKDVVKQPVKIESKIKSTSEEKNVQVYTPIDSSEKFKIDPKEISNIKNMDLRALQEKIESIKSKVLDSKSKLIEVTKDKVDKEEPVSYLSLQHVNDMGSRFSIIRLSYMLDGKNVYSGFDLYKNSKNTYPIYNSFVAPGHHEVVVEAVYSGNAEGLFDYLKDYRIRVQRRYGFVVPDGKKVVVSGTSYEKGKVFTPFKERPDINFEQKIINTIEEKVEK